ncbi:histidinol-phosphate transaminase [Halotalea alkalilenta]|uniref:histidinol-phosphate transaminase n=1 Tax=Halotalea alkalilenta TaxID=376489 RepID=UPI000488303E|nr:histidinol-phosphate transaminase [Halotalea alkalilenta]
MSKFWSPEVHQLTPYVPGEQPRQRLIKLNTNENPYPPAPGVADTLRDFDATALRLYPDPESQALRTAIAEHYAVTPEQVFVGNGSDEVLALAFMAFFRQPLPLYMPEISYSFYPVYCQLYGVERKALPLDHEWKVDLEAFPTDNGGVIFANPNAPTGHAHPREAIAGLLERQRDSVVLVDEAYVDFGAQSAVPLVERYPNLLVCGTFSKSRSLAGLRLGFAIGSKELIEGIGRVKNSFNSYPIDRLAEACAIASLADQAYFERCTAAVIATREWSREALEARGFDVLPSSSNFLFARPTRIDGPALFESLRERGLLVRHFSSPALAPFLRITIGTDEEMRTLVEAIDEIQA